LFFLLAGPGRDPGRQPLRQGQAAQGDPKVIPTFTDSQIRALLGVINTKTARGYRDMALILLMPDSAIRVSELCGLKLADVHLKEGIIKVLGKGNKERVTPIGREIQRILWRYMSRFRPAPFLKNEDLLFLTHNGHGLNKDRLQKIMSSYGTKAGRWPIAQEL
jgi:integrase/recombinase XerD